MTERLRQSVRAAMSTLTLYFCYMSFDLEVFPKVTPSSTATSGGRIESIPIHRSQKLGQPVFFSWVYPKDFSKSVKRIFSVYKENLQSGGGGSYVRPPKIVWGKAKTQSKFCFFSRLALFLRKK